MTDYTISTEAQLKSLYGETLPAAIFKELDHINDSYRRMIELAPFFAMASGGPGGMDCSPKGDAPGFVHILDDKTLAIPDRPGNNRLDTFHNILRDPRVAMLFLIPGVGETLRVNGRAEISIDPALMQRFVVNGKPPRCVLIVHIDSIYFHCSKAVVRSKLWSQEAQVDRKTLPSTGAMITELSQGKVDGDQYDREAPEKIKSMLY